MPESKGTSAKKSLNDLLAEHERRQARKDPVFFVRHFCRTFDPRPEAYPHIIDFDPYSFQEDLIRELVDAIRNSWDDFIEKSRDMGASWIVVYVLVWFWLFEQGFQALIGSYIEDFVDNGEMDSLFGKIVFTIEHLKDSKILPSGFSMDKHKTYMSLTNPDNGNAILGKAPTKKFGRSGRYTVVIFDELGFWQWGRQAWAAAGDSARCRIAITTPPDEPSYAKVLRFSGKVHVTTLHWRQHPLKNDEWYEGEKKRRTQEEVLHEIDISWEYSASARPYPESDNLPFGNYPYNPSLPIYVSLDVGLDSVAIGYYQPVQNSDWWTLVDAFESQEHIINWYFPMFGLPIDSSGKYTYTDDELEFIEHVKYWKRGIYFGDPSGKARHVESVESAYGEMRKVGLYVQSNDKENDFKSRRDATKRLLPRLQINDTPRTRWWQECMKTAKYPKRHEESQSTTEITKPIHDWTSHHRTQTEFFAVNYKIYPALPEQQGKARKREYDSSGRLLT